MELKLNNWKKDIVLFLSGQTISLFGSSLVQYAIMWHITLTTQSGTMMTIFILCGFLPTLILSPFAGVWADRYNRKRLIILADSFIALATLILALLFMFGYNSLNLLFILSAVRAFGSGVHSPAIGAIIPQIVPEDKLTRINALNSSIQSMVFLVSPMVSAALVNYFPIDRIFLIDVFTAATAIFILVAFLKIPSHAKAQLMEKSSYSKDFKDGYHYIKNHSYIRQFFLFMMVFFLLISPLAFLTPLQTTRSYGDDVWRLSALEIAFSGGMMLGGAIMAYWGGFKNKIHTMVLSIVVTGLGTIGLGLKPNFAVYLAMMAIMGTTMPMFNTPSTVLLQRKVDPDFLGRVFGVFGMIHSSMMPIGMLLFGPLADIISIEILLLVTGTLIFIMSFFMLRNKEMLRAGE